MWSMYCTVYVLFCSRGGEEKLSLHYLRGNNNAWLFVCSDLSPPLATKVEAGITGCGNFQLTCFGPTISTGLFLKNPMCLFGSHSGCLRKTAGCPETEASCRISRSSCPAVLEIEKYYCSTPATSCFLSPYIFIYTIFGIWSLWWGMQRSLLRARDSLGGGKFFYWTDLTHVEVLLDILEFSFRGKLSWETFVS